MKKRIKNSIALFLTLAIVLTAIPLSVSAAEASAQDETIINNDIISESNEPYALSEIEEKRTKDTKYFLMSDKSTKVCVYPENVHYKDGDIWEDYDNTLKEIETQENGNKELTNKSADFSIKLSKKTNGKKLVRLDKSGYKISWYYDNANKSTAEIIKNNTENDIT